jgi:glycine N-methyltransferase
MSFAEFKISLASEFRLSYYPHKLDDFKGILKEIFGRSSNHAIFGDFKAIQPDDNPAFYIHVIEKSK